MGELIPYSDIERMARAVAKSGLFGINTPEQALALMLIAQAEGKHPAVAARDYHVIKGRPTLKADTLLARFIEAGGKVEWRTYTDTAVSATFSHPSGGTVTIDWDIKRAEQADLHARDTWQKYPRQMLRARVISEGVRTVYPGIAVGVYTSEEIMDFDDAPRRHRTTVARQPEPILEQQVDQPQPLPDPQDDISDLKAAFEAACAEHGIVGKNLASLKRCIFQRPPTRVELEEALAQLDEHIEHWTEAVRSREERNHPPAQQQPPQAEDIAGLKATFEEACAEHGITGRNLESFKRYLFNKPPTRAELEEVISQLDKRIELWTEVIAQANREAENNSVS